LNAEPGFRAKCPECCNHRESKQPKVKALVNRISAKRETIAEATGAHIYTLDPVVTGPLEAEAYINIMDRNLRTLQEALK